MMAFEERGKQEHPEKNLLEQSREPTKISSHFWRLQRFDPRLHWWMASAGATLALPLVTITSYILATSFVSLTIITELYICKS